MIKRIYTIFHIKEYKSITNGDGGILIISTHTVDTALQKRVSEF